MSSNKLWQLDIVNECQYKVPFSEGSYKYSTQCAVADVPPKDTFWIKFSVKALLVSSSSCLQAISSPLLKKISHQTYLPSSSLYECSLPCSIRLFPLHWSIHFWTVFWLCILSFPKHLFLPVSVPTWISHSVILEFLVLKSSLNCSTAVPYWKGSWSSSSVILPDNSVTKLVFFLFITQPLLNGGLLSFLAYPCFLGCGWRLLSLHTFLTLSFISLEIWSSSSLCIFPTGLLHSFA